MLSNEDCLEVLQALVAAHVEAAGMAAENIGRQIVGSSPAYVYGDFVGLLGNMEMKINNVKKGK